MKVKNKIEELFKQTMNCFDNEELNLLFDYTFDMVIYTNNNNRYLCLDDNNQILINEECSLFYYFKKAKVYYKNIIENTAKNDLKKQINALIRL